MSGEDFNGLCCVKGCALPELAMGFCNKHWRRLKKYGSPVRLALPAGAYRGLPVHERFMKHVKKVSNGCWEWQSGTDADGYGLFHGVEDGVTYRRAHRYSFALHHKVHPAGAQNVMHSCDNRLCVNPDHLSLGTSAENQRDKWAKGRGWTHKGVDHWSTTLTEDDVRNIRASNEPQKVIAARYGVTQTTISDIRRRKSWAHIE